MSTNRLTWTASLPGDAPIGGYRLYNADTDALIVDTPLLTFDHEGLDPGTYRYYVIAYSTDDQVSVQSNIVTLVITAPATCEIYSLNETMGIPPPVVEVETTPVISEVPIVVPVLNDGNEARFVVVSMMLRIDTVELNISDITLTSGGLLENAVWTDGQVTGGACYFYINVAFWVEPGETEAEILVDLTGVSGVAIKAQVSTFGNVGAFIYQKLVLGWFGGSGFDTEGYESVLMFTAAGFVTSDLQPDVELAVEFPALPFTYYDTATFPNVEMRLDDRQIVRDAYWIGAGTVETDVFEWTESNAPVGWDSRNVFVLILGSLCDEEE